MGTSRLRTAAAAAATGSASTAVEVKEDNRPLILQALEDPNQLAEIEKALPPGVDLKRFVRITLTALKSNPQLIELGATKEGMRSLIAAIHRCAQMGLEPNSDLGHAYLLPYRMNGKLTLQVILGYKGLLHMARRSGGLERLDVHEVYEHDYFEFSYGLDGTLVHKPKLVATEAERGEVICYYGFAQFTAGGYYYTVLTLADVAARRNRSSNKSNKSPWFTDPVAMGKKSVIRAMAPYLPLDAAQMEMVELDEKLIDGDGNTQFIDVGTVSHSGAEADPSGPVPDSDAAAPDSAPTAPDGADDAPSEPAQPDPDPDPDPDPEPEPPRVGCACGVPGDAPPSAHDPKCKLVQE